MQSVVIDNNILNIFQRDEQNFNLFCEKLKKGKYEIFLPQVIFIETAGRLANNEKPTRERLNIIKVIYNQCTLRVIETSGQIIENEINKKGNSKNLLFMSEYEIRKVFNNTEVLRENIRRNDEEEHKKIIESHNNRQLTGLFRGDYTEDQCKEIVKLFKKEGFKANSSNESLYLKFIEHEFKCFEKVSKNTFKISHKKAIAKRILDKKNSFKYLKCLLSLHFCNAFEWIKEKSEVKNDPNKNLDNFNEELNRDPRNYVADLSYAAFSAYSKYLISEDKKLRSRLTELCKILPFEAINLEEFLKS